MQQAQAQTVPIWRKTLNIGLLPIIIFLWMTGWILTQIGSKERPQKISQKSMVTPTESEAHKKESRIPDEDSRIAYEPEIIA